MKFFLDFLVLTGAMTLLISGILLVGYLFLHGGGSV